MMKGRLAEICKTRDGRLLGIGLILAAAALALQAGARMLPGFATWYAHSVYAAIVNIVGRIFGVFPFSVVEIGLYLLILYFLVCFARNWRRPFRTAVRAVFASGLLLFLYTANCGINYHAAAFSEYAGLKPGAYSKEELISLCEYLTEQVNAYAPADRAAYAYKGHRGQWRQDSVLAMKAAGERYPVLGGYYPKPKETAVSWILSVQQLCGIYSPFTVEANYNGDMPDYNVPHTMCHELSHLKGFMREDEANFIGYLACTLSENPAFRYSGYLTGWVYAGNALEEADPEAYGALYGELCQTAREDLLENNAFWNRYEGTAAEVSARWNDTYLKMNAQEDGVRSYGRMVDLMLAYRRTAEENGTGGLEE